MPYNQKQYEPALDFLGAGDENVVNVWDKKRIQAYDLYEKLYMNATVSLKIVLRGDDQTAILMPSGKKIVEATNRFLGVKLDYFVDSGGDEGARQEVDLWWSDFFKREAIRSKFESNKRWGLIRGDSAFYIYAKENKAQGRRICIEELDPRQIFEIEDDPDDPKAVTGLYLVESVQDWRDPDKPDKKVAKRRSFRKIAAIDGEGAGITTDVKFFEIGKWDDRTVAGSAELEIVTEGAEEHGAIEEYQLPPEITQLPVYRWRNSPLQNSSWGHSQLTGLETLLYAVNQSLSDEDATIVFQGLGMYVTTAGPPRGADGQTTDWNIGPKQIIEIGQDQKFERVTGVSDITPFTQHMDYIDKGMAESSGTPEVAIGRVDVSIAESGISLQLQMMPLLAQNAEKELEMVVVVDQMFHDITTMWLPSYEPEQFGNVDTMKDLNVVCIFDDPMPKNRDARVQEVVLLDQANLILKTMTIQELRDLGYRYPTVGADNQPLTDDDIAAMLLDQQAALTAALDPFAAAGGGNPADQEFPEDQQSNTPDQQMIDLGIT